MIRFAPDPRPEPEPLLRWDDDGGFIPPDDDSAEARRVATAPREKAAA